jgi:tetratricopeptide (TPR) repeat protein
VNASPSSYDDLFQKGLAAYQNKQFQEARDNFQRILGEGHSSAPLLHNLALSYFQLDQKPYAMAFWRKALAQDPGYRPALKGREFLEAKFNMRPFEKDSFSLWLRRILERASVYEILWALAIILGSGGWLWIRYFAERRTALEEELALPAVPLAGILIAILFVATSGILVEKIQALNEPRATVVLPKVSARSLPSDEGVGVFDLSGGSEVAIRRQNENWFQVQNSEGASGWVKKEEIEPSQERIL